MNPPRLAVLTNNRHEVFQRGVIAGALEVAGRRGMEVEVGEVPSPARAVTDLPLDPRRLAGALVIANVLHERALDALVSSGLAVTLVSHRAAGADVPSVMHDNRQGMALLMAHLVTSCGRSRFAFIRGDMTQTDGVEREAAFRQEALRHGLQVPEDHYLAGGFEPRAAARVFEAFLAAAPDIDAVVSADYLMAISAQEVLAAAGRKVPEDVALVGFGDGPEAAAAQLTTVAADVVELGRRGARQLIGQVEGLQIRGETLLSTNLVRRRSSC